QAGKKEEALKELKGLLKKKKSSYDRGNIMCRMAGISAGGEKKRLLKEIFVNYPASECVYGANGPVSFNELTASEQLTRANRLYESMEYSEAAKIYKGLVEKGMGGLEIIYRLGLIHLEKDRDDAKKALEYFLETYNAGKYREDSLYRIARSYAKLENYGTALEYYQKYLKEFPKGRYREAAYYYLGWLPFDHGEYEKAVKGFDLYLKKIKKGEKRSYIVWFRAWAFYKMGRFGEAIKAFDLLMPFGNSLVAGKGLYWSGMAFRKLNNNAAAATKMKEVLNRYPLTYYAVLAAKRLNEWNGEKLPEWIAGESPLKEYPAEFWGFDKIRDKTILDSLKKVKTLVDLGEEQRARSLYHKSCRGAEKFFKGVEKARFLLTVHISIGGNHELFQRSQKEFSGAIGAVPDEKSALYWLLAYPAAERNIARVVAERFKMPELWIYSIMRQESRYRHNQVSHTDALGLMQVIPQTAKIIGEKIGVKFDPKKFFDPGRNLLFSAFYLSSLLKEK
ncbi:MAG: tetratricopeptide repeat protein, partial [Deltaproteobacteria bacterium]|nr:tetratricopeptide repeat protein [Deltaproteobacteria bacterium]